jgi:hypothetical protein
MGWRFRRSFKVIPGVRLNLSKSGLSASFGGAPFTLNVGPRGAYGTASIPGTGVSFRQHFAEESPTASPSDAVTPLHLTPYSRPIRPPVPVPQVSSAPIEEVRSVSTELLTSESLKELKRVIQTAYEEHEDIDRELQVAREEYGEAQGKYVAWDNGFLFKRIFKNTFAKRKADSDTAKAKVEELEQQLLLTTVSTHVEIAKEQAEPYFRMRDEFASLSECAAIWDIKSHQATDKFRERTIANMRVGRDRVAFSLGSCDLIQWEQKVPHLANANGGDLFLYPGFILYRAAREAFSVIDFHDVIGNCDLVKFQEEEAVPSDAKVIGQTWAKANKDGSPDRRFVNNHQIPIAAYASLTLKSETGLWEEFQFSNPERLVQFLKAFNAFVSSFPRFIA